jgi:hypothetical protein
MPFRPKTDNRSDLERFMAKRMGAKTIEVSEPHFPVSQPDTITNLILQATGRRGFL